MPSNLKPKTYRNEKYLVWIRQKPCLIPGCFNRAEPHHVRRQYWGAGISKKPHDYVAVPLCREHHNPSIEDEFNIYLVIISQLMEYIEKIRKERKGKDADKMRKVIENALSDSESWGPGEAIE